MPICRRSLMKPIKSRRDTISKGDCIEVIANFHARDELHEFHMWSWGSSAFSAFWPNIECYEGEFGQYPLNHWCCMSSSLRYDMRWDFDEKFRGFPVYHGTLVTIWMIVAVADGPFWCFECSAGGGVGSRWSAIERPLNNTSLCISLYQVPMVWCWRAKVLRVSCVFFFYLIHWGLGKGREVVPSICSRWRQESSNNCRWAWTTCCWSGH